ncbi:CsxC family protein [Maledivibacter halophilus]|uniref:SipL SPOCS domain-containing protein n=1 Tax=Maledivibacter halophilus TaxID=36842 RepID=A0A1T5L3N0_9FIRM|nr:hypothetical protein [Maledivibacter halophilus]SKC70008.1 hypothetical protein SAMN02194393_02358 [Maledivibacter halophilus]
MVENSSQTNEIVVKQNCVDVSANVVESCENTPIRIEGITDRVIAKIPVVLAKFNVQVNVSAKVKLPEIALEIKNVKIKLMLTQCMLLQDTNTLFIKGLVRKNIDYSTIEKCPTTKDVCGDIRHCTVNIPFECTTTVEFNGFPPAEIVPSTWKEFQYFQKQKLPNNFAEKDRLLSGDLSEFNQNSTEYYNDLPYCELVNSSIINLDEYLNRKIIRNGPIQEGVFEEFEEKMTINIVLRVLQHRLVEIN